MASSIDSPAKGMEMNMEMLAWTLEAKLRHSEQRPRNRRRPLYIEGPPGIGKTEVTFQVADKKGYDVLVLETSRMDPTDLTGIPVPNEQGFTVHAPAEFIYRLTEEYHAPRLQQWIAEGKAEKDYPWPKPTILFFDDVSAGNEQVLNTMLAMLTHGTVGMGGAKLLSSVQIMAAGNTADHGAHVRELSTAIISRFEVVRTVPDFEAWVKWARTAEVHPGVLSYLRGRERQFYDLEPGLKGEPFPCPRSWVGAGEAMVAYDADAKVLRRAVAGNVGIGAATEFLSWWETKREAPSAEEIFRDPDNAKVFDRDNDLSLVVVENLIYGINRHPDQIENLLRYSKRMHPQHKRILYPHFLNTRSQTPPEVVAAAMDLPDDQFEELQEHMGRTNRALNNGDAHVKRKRGS